ncbi:outer membrane assembly protein AsmA [Erwiniaceae bacterium BAC15a-03b]|uniref:Outer membrane assembly protein AsmA n=1 Tax=Winslowiella arboricola TaxID=2978220 RepID=A0A9J6PVH6_9GAMM|nr:outer membrane assembly protein AsmA [Winslowiella arboricola]MCU5774265.1 outer membrane assembly protein AsmA [Winslowiella arboricola]MCU5778812.1 outer membrane assembly protein AsmA [Winslowiella arboricola]
MRRLITALGILLVVIVAGMSALVLLVNPNDFRAYMVQQVEQRSGYKLALEGDLRWHVWPQLSILAGRMSITAPGAQQPLVNAENMRLDVNLLPLFSHQLSVKQVMLKNAVIRMTPESEAQRPQDAPIGPSGSSVPEAVSGWKFDIGQLQVADSLLIWQQAGGEQINFRDINLDLSQDDRKQAQVELSTRVSRDQRELLLALKGHMNVAQYPQQLTGNIQQLSWQLKGVDLPPQGLKGEGTLLAEWLNDRQQFSLKNLALSVNDSQLNGTITGRLGVIPDLNIDLHSAKLDVDALTGHDPAAQEQGSSSTQVQLSGRAPVISQPADRNSANSPLNDFTAEVKMQVDALRWRGMDFNQLVFDARNDRGQIAINTLSGKSGGGDFAVPGTINLRGPQSKVAFQPQLHAIELAPLLKGFELPETVSGKLSMEGDLHGNGLSVADFKQNWRGNAEISMDNARLAGLNFQQMVQRAVERSSDQVRGSDSEANYTEVQQLKGSLQLDNGSMALVNLQGRSALLDLAGKGVIDLDQQQCDITFNIKVISGWQGDNALVQTLSNTAVPLRLYGSWDGLQYSLPVDQLLRKRIQDEAKSRLNNWIQRNPDSKYNDDAKKLLK